MIDLRRLVALSLTTLAVAFAGVANAQRPESQLLKISLSSPIKPNAACLGDADDQADWDWDCLDDAQENFLAFLVNPHFAWDEEEGCNWFSEQTSYSQLHEKPQVYFQVRPSGTNITGWSNDGSVKWVWVAYYFMYPIDCQSSGHLGDGEKIYVRMYTKNLQDFFIDAIDYFAHGRQWHVGGDSVKTVSAWANNGVNGVGTFPWVLSSEDSHGSFPGSSSSDCGGNEGIFDDCLSPASRANIFFAQANAAWTFLPLTGNIGEPMNEGGFGTEEQGWFNWIEPNNPDGVLQRRQHNASRFNFFVARDTGHGPFEESLSVLGDVKWDDKFCGWKCHHLSRNSVGDCLAIVENSRRNCAGPGWNGHLMHSQSSKFPHVPYTR